MNFNAKGYCDPNHSSGTSTQKTSSAAWNARKWYNNRADCIEAGFNWYEISHKDILSLNATNNFVCAHTQYSRVNQLGNADGDAVISQNELDGSFLVNSKIAEGLNANRFMWKVPNIPTPARLVTLLTTSPTVIWRTHTKAVSFELDTTLVRVISSSGQTTPSTAL